MIVAVLGLAAFSPAQAALIVNAVQGGPFSPANPTGTIDAIDLTAGNTYDFTFAIAGGGDVLTEIQAAVFKTGAEPIDFSLFSGTPGSGTLLDTSTFSDGPALTDMLGVGSYYLQVGTIAVSGEQLDGSLEVEAVPEAATWALMTLGLGLAGATLRRRRVLIG
jgi:hypothetical protein